MRITFLGATHEVTGSCTYLEACGKHILIDCGMEQGPDEFENQEIPVAASDIDMVLLTHAHIDHSGKLPLLYQRGFRGQISGSGIYPAVQGGWGPGGKRQRYEPEKADPKLSGFQRRSGIGRVLCGRRIYRHKF